MSYAIKIRDGVGDTVSLIGHDRMGNPRITITMARGDVQYSMLDTLELMCRAVDTAPVVKLS